MMNTNPFIAICLAAGFAGFASFASAEIGTVAGTACETQVVPVMPRGALREFRHDLVKVRARVRDGIVQEVQIVKGPRVYANAIREAMERYRCRIQGSEYWVSQEFEFDARLD